MTTMQMGSKFVHLLGAAVAAAIWLGASPASAQSCPAGTAVDAEPAGDTIAGDLASGTSAVFTAGTISVTCGTSHTSGALPVAGNPGDPVAGTLTPATFTSCTSSIGFSATTTTNSTNGSWGLSATCGNQATLHIPRAGAVTRVATCTITVAPTAAVDIPATIVPGANGAPPQLVVDAVLPIARSGLLCPNASTARFQATYNVTDVTNPSSTVTFTEVPAP